MEYNCNNEFDWQDTCYCLPESKDVWFICEGKIYVGVYEPNQKIFCMADGLGVELKYVRQWKYVGSDKQIAKFPKENEVIGAKVKNLPCLVTCIFSHHFKDTETGNDTDGILLDAEYEFCDNANVFKWGDVSYYFTIPEEPIVLLDAVGDAEVNVLPDVDTVIIDKTGATHPEDIPSIECEDCQEETPNTEECTNGMCSQIKQAKDSLQKSNPFNVKEEDFYLESWDKKTASILKEYISLLRK